MDHCQIIKIRQRRENYYKLSKIGCTKNNLVQTSKPYATYSPLNDFITTVQPTNLINICNNAFSSNKSYHNDLNKQICCEEGKICAPICKQINNYPKFDTFVANLQKNNDIISTIQQEFITYKQNTINSLQIIYKKLQFYYDHLDQIDNPPEFTRKMKILLISLKDYTCRSIKILQNKTVTQKNFQDILKENGLPYNDTLKKEFFKYFSISNNYNPSEIFNCFNYIFMKKINTDLNSYTNFNDIFYKFITKYDSIMSICNKLKNSNLQESFSSLNDDFKIIFDNRRYITRTETIHTFYNYNISDIDADYNFLHLLHKDVVEGRINYFLFIFTSDLHLIMVKTLKYRAYRNVLLYDFTIWCNQFW